MGAEIFQAGEPGSAKLLGIIIDSVIEQTVSPVYDVINAHRRCAVFFPSVIKDFSRGRSVVVVRPDVRPVVPVNVELVRLCAPERVDPINGLRFSALDSVVKFVFRKPVVGIYIHEFIASAVFVNVFKQRPIETEQVAKLIAKTTGIVIVQEIVVPFRASVRKRIGI